MHAQDAYTSCKKESSATMLRAEASFSGKLQASLSQAMEARSSSVKLGKLVEAFPLSTKGQKRTKKEGQVQIGKPPRLKHPRLAALKFGAHFFSFCADLYFYCLGYGCSVA